MIITLSAHFIPYLPHLFGLEGQGTWGTTADYTTLRNKFIAVKTWSDANNVPVLLGEFGSLKKCDYNSRMKHYRAYVEFAQQYGFIACAWDDGGDFRIMERPAHQWDEVKRYSFKYQQFGTQEYYPEYYTGYPNSGIVDERSN